jgi:predicted nuclease of predicted toxin-antitoxin system
MKLLFDQNLSPALVQKLADLFPGSTHTEPAGLTRSDDLSIWEYCQREGFVVVSKDNDFGFLAMQRGTPPKAICIRWEIAPHATLKARFAETPTRFDPSERILRPPC